MDPPSVPNRHPSKVLCAFSLYNFAWLRLLECSKYLIMFSCLSRICTTIAHEIDAWKEKPNYLHRYHFLNLNFCFLSGKTIDTKIFWLYDKVWLYSQISCLYIGNLAYQNQSCISNATLQIKCNLAYHVQSCILCAILSRFKLMVNQDWYSSHFLLV